MHLSYRIKYIGFKSRILGHKNCTSDLIVTGVIKSENRREKKIKKKILVNTKKEKKKILLEVIITSKSSIFMQWHQLVIDSCQSQDVTRIIG